MPKNGVGRNMEDIELTPEIREKIRTFMSVARYNLLRSSSWRFYGVLALGLEFEENESIPTLATDGKKIYYNPKFILTLDRNRLIAAIAHEILHCVYLHVGRRGDRDPNYWNMAIDYIVNSDIVTGMVGTIDASWLYDPKYNSREWTSEQVYEHLVKTKPPVKQSFDVHLDVGGNKGSDSNDKGDGKKPKKGGEDPGGLAIDPDDAKELEREIKAKVLAAAYQVDAGSIPVGVRRIIEQMIEPKIDWRELLADTIKSLFKDDYHFKRLSRKSYYYGFPLPSMKEGETVDIVCFLDMSGSISERQARDFISEVYGLVSQYKDFRLILGTFDTGVYNVKEFDAYNIHEVEEYELKGGGGTDFNAFYNYLKKEGIVPDQLLVFTDGYPFNGWGDPDYCPVLWIIHSDGRNDRVKPPFGEWAYYEEFE